MAIGVFMFFCAVKAGASTKEDATGLSRVRPAATQQDAEAAGQGEAARGPAKCYTTERDTCPPEMGRHGLEAAQPTRRASSVPSWYWARA
jgi:hypothetical protein